MGLIAHSESFEVATNGRGFYDVTERLCRKAPIAAISSGVCTLSIMHTSASLIIFENADPTAKHDIEAWMRRHVPDGDPSYRHSDEGRDDMPSHIRSALTATTLSIPIHGGKLMLGTWQGVYLWEHRTAPHRRTLALACLGEGRNG